MYGPTNITLTSSILGDFNVFSNTTIRVISGNGATFGGSIVNQGTMYIQLPLSDTIMFTHINNTKTINVVSGTVFLLVILTLKRNCNHWLR